MKYITVATWRGPPCCLQVPPAHSRASISPRSRSKPPISVTRHICWKARAATSRSRSAPTASSWWTRNSRRCTTRSRTRLRKFRRCRSSMWSTPTPRRPRRRDAAFHRTARPSLRTTMSASASPPGTPNAVTGNKTPPAEPLRSRRRAYMVGDRSSKSAAASQNGASIPAHTRRRHLGHVPRRQRARRPARLRQQDLSQPRLGQWRQHRRHGPCARNIPQGGQRFDQIVPGHGPVATKANLQEFRRMMVTARDRVKKLYDAGKTEQEVLAADPLADLNVKWAARRASPPAPAVCATCTTRSAITIDRLTNVERREAVILDYHVARRHVSARKMVIVARLLRGELLELVAWHRVRRRFLRKKIGQMMSAS